MRESHDRLTPCCITIRALLVYLLLVSTLRHYEWLRLNIAREWTAHVVRKIKTHPTGAIRSVKDTGAFANDDEPF
ncbi:MAG TPA: hypothetical protein VLE19_14145, partial [Pyrinomonadaceae bacterium]|nr:hypothetical protein [Pyrinomonadaceae bacterium]